MLQHDVTRTPRRACDRTAAWASRASSGFPDYPALPWASSGFPDYPALLPYPVLPWATLPMYYPACTALPYPALPQGAPGTLLPGRHPAIRPGSRAPPRARGRPYPGLQEVPARRCGDHATPRHRPLGYHAIHQLGYPVLPCPVYYSCSCWASLGFKRRLPGILPGFRGSLLGTVASLP